MSSSKSATPAPTPAPLWTPQLEPGPVNDALQRVFGQLASLQAQISNAPSPATTATPAKQSHNVPYAVDGKPAAGAATQVYTYTHKVTYQTNFAGAQGSALTPATGNAKFTILKNGIVVGSFTATPASTATKAKFVFSSQGPQSFGPGDYMTIQAPGTQDATLAGLHVNLTGAIDE